MEKRRDQEPVICDPAMIAAHARARSIALGKVNVLLLGETGSGKEIFAETIHLHSPRRDGPFLRLNCALLSESLFESEVFGHEKSAFTGATRTTPGLLESADGGTLFLDELGEMPPGLQAKLLRVLEDGQVTRVGGLKPRTIDVRFVCATNRNLEEEIAHKRFRRDLYYRLKGAVLGIPPLRDRPAEILPLAQRFLQVAARHLEREPPPLSPAAIEALRAHRWPGNVRELRNVVERALLLGQDVAEIGPQHLLLESRASVPAAAAPALLASGHLDQVWGGVRAGLPVPAASAPHDRDLILDALERCGGNQSKAARLLGVPRSRLITLLTEYALPRPRKSVRP